MRRVLGNMSLVMIIGCILGFALSLMVIFAEALPFGSGAVFRQCADCKGLDPGLKGILNNIPPFFAWIMLFVIHTAGAVGLGLAALQMNLRIFASFRIPTRTLTIIFGLVLLMAVLSSFSYIYFFKHGEYYQFPRTPLNHEWTKVITLHIIGILSASFSVIGLITISYICYKIEQSPIKGDMLHLYFELLDGMETFLMITGYVLSTGMITVYFYKSTEEVLGLGKLFNSYTMGICGVLFCIFIAITFIPCRLMLTALGKRISAHQLGVAPKEPFQLKIWLDASTALTKHMKLEFNFIETIKYAVPILSPLLGSFIPEYFKLHI